MTRHCPRCNEQYDDTWLVCLKDNTTLVDRAGNKCTDVDRDTTDYVRLAIDEGKNELRDIGITPEKILQEAASRFADPSAYSLVIANLITIVMAALERWDLWTVIFVYLIQNVVIGFFSVLRIADLRKVEYYEPSEDGILQDIYKNFKSDTSRKLGASLFFILHYSIFNLMYFIILIDKKISNPQVLTVYFILANAAYFFINHLISFLRNRSSDRDRDSLKKAMWFPYLRIVPMHIILFSGAIFGPSKESVLYVAFFMLLKTCVDVEMHYREHA